MQFPCGNPRDVPILFFTGFCVNWGNVRVLKVSNCYVSDFPRMSDRNGWESLVMKDPGMPTGAFPD
jgi:hypothetical protein